MAYALLFVILLRLTVLPYLYCYFIFIITYLKIFMNIVLRMFSTIYVINLLKKIFVLQHIITKIGKNALDW